MHLTRQRLGLTLFAVLASVVALSTACASKIACADLGSEWTTCPSPNAEICVLKGKEGACNQIGSSTSSSSTSSSGATTSSGATSSGTSGTSGTSSGCTSSFETNCNGTCVFLSSDDNNCGRCGNACLSNQVCFSGDCK